jgi:hypothetical protein
MTLATLASVKDKLGIPTTDTSLDTAITACLAGADAWAKGQTGYDEIAAVHTEYLTQVEHDAWLTTKYRPVDSAVAILVQTRAPGSTTRSTLTADLVDAMNGKIKLVPVGASGAPWELDEDAGEYSIVELTYTTKAFSVADTLDLVDAVAELAAYWFTEHRANIKSGSAGPVAESYINAPIPPSVQAVIWRHKRGIASWA